MKPVASAEWLEEFADNLVEEASASSEAPVSISREPLHQEPPIKVVSASTAFSLSSNENEIAQYERGAENALVIKYFEQKSW